MQILHRHFGEHDQTGEWALLIGNFDGFHLGHQELVKHTLAEKQRLGVRAGLLTFEPHPKMVLQPQNPFHHIYDDATKLELMEQSGLDSCFIIPFTPEFAKTTPAEFCELLFDFVSIRSIVVGYDFNFGRSRQGGAMFLAEEAQKREVAFHQLPPVKYQNVTCSSTIVRRLLFEGDFALAARILGRTWTLKGQVQEGLRLGRQLGFPTLNLHPSVFYPLRLGVYVIRAKVGGGIFSGVANMGYSPTLADQPLKVEVHLFDFDQTCYGQEVEIEPLHFVREEHRFPTLEALKAQIARDVEQAKTWLRLNP